MDTVNTVSSARLLTQRKSSEWIASKTCSRTRTSTCTTSKQLGVLTRSLITSSLQTDLNASMPTIGRTSDENLIYLTMTLTLSVRVGVRMSSWATLRMDARTSITVLRLTGQRSISTLWHTRLSLVNLEKNATDTTARTITNLMRREKRFLMDSCHVPRLEPLTCSRTTTWGASIRDIRRS